MKIFKTIVMSDVEPNVQSTLWLKPKKSTVDKNGPTKFDIWYFSELGWKPLADFDTRYNFTSTYNEAISSDSLVINSTKNTKDGIVDNNLNFSIYNGSRDIKSSNNFVLESGLKKEIDALKKYIDTNIKKLDERISALATRLGSVESTAGNNSSRLSGVEERLTALESAIS